MISAIYQTSKRGSRYSMPADTDQLDALSQSATYVAALQHQPKDVEDMNKFIFTIVLTLLLWPFTTSWAEDLKLETLMKSKLEGLPGTEVIVSRVEIPAHTSLLKHWHPGEEFAYVLKGRVTLWQQGKKDIIVQQGDVAKVPLKQVHTATTGADGVVLLVFRVHEEGEPERVKAE